MSELHDLAINNDLVAGVLPSGILSSVYANSSISDGTASSSSSSFSSGSVSSKGLVYSSSSSSRSFVNDEGAGASSSAVSTSPDGTVSDSQTVFTPGATSSSASASAIASSTEPGTAIAMVGTSDGGDVFAIAPSTGDQPLLTVNITPEIEFGLIDIQSIEPLLLTVNFAPNVEFEFAPIELGDRVNVLFETDFAVSSSASDTSASQSSSSTLVEDFNVSISLFQQESSQPEFTISRVIVLSDPIVFDPISLKFSLKLEFYSVPVTAAD